MSDVHGGEPMKAQLFDLLYAFPVRLFGQIGKLSQLKSDSQSVTGNAWRDDPAGMPDPELRLCNDYYAAFAENVSSKPVFENAYAYLVHSYQTGTRPMAFWQHLLLLALTLAEAAGTGFLLAPWVSQEMSAAQVSYVGWIIAFAFAFGMLIMTHAAGQSYKKAALFNAITAGKDQTSLDHVRPISLSMPQEADAEQKPEVRFVARVSKGPRDRGSFWPTVATIGVLAAALAFIFYIRWEGIKEAETHQVVHLEHHGVSSASSNPFANLNSGSSSSPLPPAVQQAQQQARDRVAHEIAREHAGQGFGAAALLSFIYIMTQAAGFLFSYEHAFLADGEQAYRLTRGESHYETYVRSIGSPYLNCAESRLAELRQYLVAHVAEYAKSPSRVSFLTFYNRRQADKLGQEDLAGMIKTADTPRPAPAAAPAQAAASAAPALARIGASDDELRSAAQEIYALGDSAARKDRFRQISQGLGSAEQMKLLDFFNQIKDERARVQALAEDLFKE